MANQSIYNAFERMWQHVIAALGNKANKTEIDTAIAELETQVNNKADSEHVHDTYETKIDANTKLDETKDYIDNVASRKADKAHSHQINDISSLQTTLDEISEKANESGLFVVTFTQKSVNTLSADKTIAEILEAYNNDKRVVGFYLNALFRLITVANNKPGFATHIGAWHETVDGFKCGVLVFRSILMRGDDEIYYYQKIEQGLDIDKYYSLTTENKTVIGAINELDSELDSHAHDNIYYTETEIDQKLSDVNISITNITSGSTPVKEAEHADSADIATNATNANHAISADSATSATKATQDASGNVITETYETKTNAQVKFDESKAYTDTITGELSDELSEVIYQMYGNDITDDGVPTIREISKEESNKSLNSAKSYTDTKVSGLASNSSVDTKINTHNTSTSAHNDIRILISGLTTRLNALADSDDTTLDQMSEIVAYIKSNKSLIDSVTTSKINVSDIVNNLTTSSTSKVLSASQGVAIKALIDALQEELDGHGHAIADVSGLQSALDGKATNSHGTHVTWSTTSPKMNGTAAIGSASTVARGDHIHPTDTSRASKTEFDTHTSDTTKHITSTERTNWNSAKTHADSAHAPSDAQKNQNAFSNIKVGDTTISADTTTDTLTLVGSNVTITPDATNDKVTIAVASGSTSTKGIVQLTNSTSSTSTTTAATPNSVKSAYDLANAAKTNAATAQSKADSAYALAESKVDSLSDLGITATATELNKLDGVTVTTAELNFIDGVTSNIQTQLNNKLTYNVVTTLPSTGTNGALYVIK